jgi:predicted 3-demethylubiquinone-9 3-methyltransferase (glyoxalase superfamily)
MNNSIHPCLCLKGKIAEAADFYIKTFGNGRITQKNEIVVMIELSGQKFMLLNDGPNSKPNASISFMVNSVSAAETEKYWNKLIDGGNVLMALGTYGWSEKYGWVQDKYGISWQLYTGSEQNTPQKFYPTLMFMGPMAGKAAEAIAYYTGLYPNSTIQDLCNYENGDGDNPGFLKHAQFTLKDNIIKAMDSSADYGFTFTDAISLVVACDSQAEIDKYWDDLSSGGGREIACGWVTDKYGLSWQIIPKNLSELMEDPERAKRVMSKLMQMKKLITEDLEHA